MVNENSYSNYHLQKEWHENKFGETNCNEVQYFRRVIGGRTPRKIFELGFGNGNFIGYCLSKRMEIFGYEANELLNERAAKFGVHIVTLDDAVRNKMKFDLIACFDVIEHLDKRNIHETLTKFNKILNPDGVVIIRIPNGDSPFSLPIQNGDTTHLTAIGTMMMQQLAYSADLEIKSISADSDFTVNSSYLLKPAFILQKILRIFLNRIFIFAVYPRFKGDIISPNLLVALCHKINR